MPRVGRGIQMTEKEYKKWKRMQVDEAYTKLSMLMVASENMPKWMKERLDVIYKMLGKIVEETRGW